MKRRKAIAILDVTIGLGVLSTAMIMAVQTTLWILGERQQSEVRYQAIEAAANLLEAARTCSWDDLDTKWAESRQLPSSLTERLQSPKLLVQVLPEPSRKQMKRLTVELTWTQTDGRPAPPITVTALFARRQGDKP